MVSVSYLPVNQDLELQEDSSLEGAVTRAENSYNALSAKTLRLLRSGQDVEAEERGELGALREAVAEYSKAFFPIGKTTDADVSLKSRITNLEKSIPKLEALMNLGVAGIQSQRRRDCLCSAVVCGLIFLAILIPTFFLAKRL